MLLARLGSDCHVNRLAIDHDGVSIAGHHRQLLLTEVKPFYSASKLMRASLCTNIFSSQLMVLSFLKKLLSMAWPSLRLSVPM